MRKAIRSFVLCVIASAIIGGSVIYFLFAFFIIPGKDATITNNEATIRRISEERESFKTKLADFQAGHPDKSYPLKNRAEVLAKQITDFSAFVENDKSGTNYALLSQEWGGRLQPRIDAILKGLDELGQYSGKADTLRRADHLSPPTYDPKDPEHTPRFIYNIYRGPTGPELKDIASEIKRMADAIPESDSP